jgi:hypothetical protein
MFERKTETERGERRERECGRVREKRERKLKKMGQDSGYLPFSTCNILKIGFLVSLPGVRQALKIGICISTLPEKLPSSCS